MKKRARDDKDKALRRQSILDAAWRLMDEEHVQLASASQVAKEAGVAKGTLYLYFKTKEEIYTALLKQQFMDWLDHICEAAGQSGDNTAGLVDVVIGFVEQRPKFMQLACAANSVLELNLSPEAATTYKLALADRLRKTGSFIEAHIPGLKAGQGSLLLMESYALVLGMWQLSEPPLVIRQALEARNLDVLRVEFSGRARQALTHLWRGFLRGEST